MDKFNEVVSNFAEAIARFEKLADAYLSTLERRAQAQAEASARASEKARQKAINKAFIQTLAVRVEKLHRRIFKNHRGDLH